MATAFMKWLETRPESYDRGIRWLTLGRLEELHHRLIERHAHSGMQILEIGCGTGSLSLAIGQAGAYVTAIDLSGTMLS